MIRPIVNLPLEVIKVEIKTSLVDQSPQGVHN
jgi:hypothetical protein